MPAAQAADERRVLPKAALAVLLQPALWACLQRIPDTLTMLPVSLMPTPSQFAAWQEDALGDTMGGRYMLQEPSFSQTMETTG